MERRDVLPSARDLGSQPDSSPAGDFTVWLGAIAQSIRTGAAADVPCGSCTACCTSAQFVHVGADESATLQRIPSSVLFPAPGSPRGDVLMGYDENGHCPMFVDGACSIYEHRPRACRAYDCRIFTATGVEPDVHQPAIAARVQRWRFTFADDAAVETARHLRMTATSIDPHVHPTQRAVQALAAGLDGASPLPR